MDLQSIPGLVLDSTRTTLEKLAANIASEQQIFCYIKIPFTGAAAAVTIPLTALKEFDETGKPIWSITYAGIKFAASSISADALAGLIGEVAEVALVAAGFTVTAPAALAIGIGVGSILVAASFWDSSVVDHNLKEILSNPLEYFGTELPNAASAYQKSLEINNGVPFSYSNYILNGAFPLFFNGIFTPLNNNINPGGGSTSGKDSVADSIVSQLGTQGILIDREALERINGAFTDADFDIGGLVHIPTSISTVITAASLLTYT
jgi:hypothetical protein